MTSTTAGGRAGGSPRTTAHGHPAASRTGGAAFSSIRWPSVVAGVVTAIATLALLALLLAALGVQWLGSGNDAPDGTGAAFLATLAALVAFAVGAFVAVRTADIDDPIHGALSGFLVWALALPVLLVLAAAGAGALLGPVADTFSRFGGSAATAAAGAVDADALRDAAALGVVALALSAIAAMAGGWLATRDEVNDLFRAADRSGTQRQPAFGRADAGPLTRGWAGAPRTLQQPGRTRLELLEEQLEAQKRTRSGAVRFRKEIEEQPVTMDVAVVRERLHMDARVIDRPLSQHAGATPYVMGDTVVIPIVEERLEIRKVPHVVEEVIITKTRREEIQHVTDTVRKERISIVPDADAPVHVADDARRVASVARPDQPRPVRPAGDGRTTGDGRTADRRTAVGQTGDGGTAPAQERTVRQRR